MVTLTSGAVPVARSEPRTRTALLLESIALRHQIAVLERSRTSRPCFRRIDLLLWILLSFWWPQWRESLMIVQPETVLRWRPHALFPDPHPRIPAVEQQVADPQFAEIPLRPRREVFAQPPHQA